MMNKRDHLSFLLRLYVNGETTIEQELELISEAKLPENRDLLAELLNNSMSQHVDTVEYDADRWEPVFKTIMQNAAQQEQPDRVAASSHNGKRRSFRVTIAAAAIFFIALIGYFLVTPSVDREISTVRGETRQVSLPDGSLVWLGPLSKLSYPETFAETERRVTLQGEAFFNVTENANKPFVVHSASVETKVLGTSFNVRAYQEQDHIAITVVTGKVKVTVGSAVQSRLEAQLQPNQQAIFSKSNNWLSKKSFINAAKILGNRRNRILLYEGTLVADILSDLKNYKGLPVAVMGDISTCGYYGTLSPEDDAANFLKKLAYSINADIRKNGETFLLIAKGCAK